MLTSTRVGTGFSKSCNKASLFQQIGVTGPRALASQAFKAQEQDPSADGIEMRGDSMRKNRSKSKRVAILAL